MPDEEYIKWKREEEEARASSRESPIYDDDAETKAFNLSSAVLILLIIVFCILVPFFGYIYGVLDMRW